MFLISTVPMFFVCIWVWDAFVNGKLYFCTDGGSMDFIFGPGPWVHHPESVAHVVPRAMNQPDEIKNGWSIIHLQILWYTFFAVSVLVSAGLAGAFWRVGSRDKAQRASIVARAE